MQLTCVSHFTDVIKRTKQHEVNFGFEFALSFGIGFGSDKLTVLSVSA